MTNENFRREIGQVFDDMTGSHSAALSDRVRSSLSEAPAQRGPFWIAGIAAALIAAVAVGIVVVGNFPRQTMQPISAPSFTPSPSPSPSPTPDSGLTPFTCTGSGSMILDYAQPPSQAVISGLWIGTQSSYDRLEIEWKGPVSGPTGPTSIYINPQSGTTFTNSPRGDQVKLAGNNGILVVIHNADLHTGYKGSTDLKTGYSTLVEVRQVEDFEGVVQLALGVSGATCYRFFTLAKAGGTSSLVIDVKAG
jgi:hypothetical protein